MPFLTNPQLLLILIALSVTCILLIWIICDISRARQQAMLENMQLHMANNSLSWEADMVRAELRITCQMHGIPVPRCCRHDKGARHA